VINIFQPSLGEEELREIKKVFDSSWLGNGEKVKEFEKLFSSHLKVNKEHMVAISSCTDAIFLSSELFRFNCDDEIIVPSISFSAIGSAIVSKGAKIVFCDVDRRRLNVRRQDIESKITKKTKAVYITHYGGFPCDMDPIIDLCMKHDIRIIEDSACAPKSFYKEKACGTFGDMGMWSFDSMKLISTGDGGMIYLKDSEHKNIANELIYLGMNNQKTGINSINNDKWWEYEINRIGRRSIMNNITASMGCCQLNKIDSFISRRKQIFDKYVSGLVDLDWLAVPPKLRFHYDSSYYFFWIQTDRRDELAKHLLKHDIYTTFKYWPLHKVKFFSEYCTHTYPNSEYIASKTLNLPLHHKLSNKDIDRIIEVVHGF
jgi:aminotransferase